MNKDIQKTDYCGLHDLGRRPILDEVKLMDPPPEKKKGGAQFKISKCVELSN